MTSTIISILLTLINNGIVFERKEGMKSMYLSRFFLETNLYVIVYVIIQDSGGLSLKHRHRIVST